MMTYKVFSCGTIFISLAFVCAANYFTINCCTAKTNAQPEVTKVKLFGRVDALSVACSAAGIRLESRQLPTSILKVRLGSPASYAGVLDDDQVISGTISGDTMHLNLKRQGKQYSVALKIRGDGAATLTAGDIQSGSKVFSSRTKTIQAFNLALHEKTRQSDWNVLRQYQIAVVVDQSGSMNDGIGQSDTSRWQWCCKQLESFATEAQRASSQPLSLATFNHEYHIAHKCTAAQIAAIMNASKPNGGTEFAGPLKQVIDDYWRTTRQQPLLIVMITDGETNSGAAAEQVLRDATSRMTNNNQIKLVIFQIGDTGDGADFVRRLDHDLVLGGARYDIVKAVLFDDLWQNGLRHALLKALQQD